jgi:PiT family inorganic phosphate transporter
MEQAKVYGPFFFFVVFFIIGLVTLFKGLKNLNLDFDLGTAFILSIGLGLIGFLIGTIFVRRVVAKAKDEGDLRDVERVFVVLQILTACAVAFAHGSNDVANSIGPLAAIVNSQETVEVVKKSAVAPWMLALGGVGIVFGLATWGYRVMDTVGRKITELTPSRGFAAELGAAMTIVLASRLGIPVSTTHILVGGVMGVALARSIGALDLRVVGQVLLSWVATLPLAAGLAILFFFLFQAILSP